MDTEKLKDWKDSRFKRLVDIVAGRCELSPTYDEFEKTHLKAFAEFCTERNQSDFQKLALKNRHDTALIALVFGGAAHVMFEVSHLEKKTKRKLALNLGATDECWEKDQQVTNSADALFNRSASIALWLLGLQQIEIIEAAGVDKNELRRAITDFREDPSASTVVISRAGALLNALPPTDEEKDPLLTIEQGLARLKADKAVPKKYKYNALANTLKRAGQKAEITGGPGKGKEHKFRYSSFKKAVAK